MELPFFDLEFQMFVLDELADKLIVAKKDVIKLTIGIPELPIHPQVLEKLSNTIYDRKKTRLVYPAGLPELRKAITLYYQKEFSVKVKAANVLVSVGTSTIFRNLLQLLCRPRQEVLLPRPYYCLYSLSAILAGAKITYYDIDLFTKKVDFQSFRKSYNPENTAVIVINNPGNPLGNIISKEEIIEINEIVDGRSFIINDEIYNNCLFYSDYESPLGFLPNYKDTNIVTNGFSKGFRMYTKRVGYAILPDALITPMRVIQQHTLLTHDPVNQFGCIEALKHLDEPKELMEIYRSRAEYTYEKLSGTGCHPIKSDGGFYIILECKDWMEKKNLHSSQSLARDIIESVYVSTVPGHDFGIPKCLRLAFCNDRYNEAIDRLYEYFTKE